jgi:hypothetical protein
MAKLSGHWFLTLVWCMQLLSNVDLGSEEVKAAVCEVCMDIHMSVSQTADSFYNELRRKYYTTPKSFLDLIQLYCSLLAERRQEMNESQERLLVGLQKLNQTNSVVDKMKAELGKLLPCQQLLDMHEVNKRLPTLKFASHIMQKETVL